MNEDFISNIYKMPKRVPGFAKYHDMLLAIPEKNRKRLFRRFNDYMQLDETLYGPMQEILVDLRLPSSVIRAHELNAVKVNRLLKVYKYNIQLIWHEALGQPMPEDAIQPEPALFE